MSEMSMGDRLVLKKIIGAAEPDAEEVPDATMESPEESAEPGSRPACGPDSGSRA